MALGHAIAMGIIAARNAKRMELKIPCNSCGKMVSVSAGPNAPMVCKGCGGSFCVRTCGQPFACANCLEKLPNGVRDPFTQKVKQLKTIYSINLAILLFVIISVALYFVLYPVSPIYWLLRALEPVTSHYLAQDVVFAIFGINFVCAIVAMSVSFGQARNRTERLFHENPVATQHPAFIMPGAPGSGMTGAIFPPSSEPVQGNFALNQGAPVAAVGARICGVCGYQLEDNMCFNCGAKTCLNCGFANTGADLGECAKCGSQM